MSQQVLNVPEVDSFFVQMCCEGMPQGVDGHWFFDAGFPAGFLKNSLNAALAVLSAVLPFEQPIVGAIFLQVCLQI